MDKDTEKWEAKREEVLAKVSELFPDFIPRASYYESGRRITGYDSSKEYNRVSVVVDFRYGGWGRNISGLQVEIDSPRDTKMNQIPPNSKG